VKRALVIGGTGFLGIHTVDALLAEGWDVCVSRRKRSPTLLLGRRPVTLVSADLADRDSLTRSMEGCDAVFLAGAYYPKHSLDREGALREGSAGVRNACEAALAVGVPRLVYTSSVGALATVLEDRAATEDDVPAQMPSDSVYRAVKWAMERELEAAQRRGLSAVTVLPGGCIGPLDARVGTGALLVGVVRAELPWWVDGLVNLVDVADVATAHVRAASAPAGSRYCVAGHTVRVRWVLEHIARRFGGRVPTVQLPMDEARARADVEEALAARTRHRAPVPREFVDLVCAGQRVANTRAERELGLRVSPIEAAFERAHAWYARFRYFERRADAQP